MLEFDDMPDTGQPKIKVVGVGGGGGNSVNTMIEAGVQGVDFIAINTDCQVLGANLAPIKVQIGKGLTKGLGAGAHPEVGAAAALEDKERLAELLGGADMVFVTAGMGGGTGTGAAPVVAEIARELGALTVGVVTKPFNFEGIQRKKRAVNGIGLLGKSVDALIVIPNDRLLGVAGQKTSLKDAFTLVDAVCLNAVRGISDLVMVPGLINVDFADVRTIMTGTGRALMGTGRGRGDHRAVEAAKMAINSPLLEDVSINGATGILVNITGGPDLTLAEVNEACSLVQEAADPECNIIFGSVIDANAGDEVRITVIATGFQPQAASMDLGGSGGASPRRRSDQMALPIASASSQGAVAAAPAPEPMLAPPQVVLQPPRATGALPAQAQTGEATDRSPYGLAPPAYLPESPYGLSPDARSSAHPNTSVTVPAYGNPVSRPAGTMKSVPVMHAAPSATEMPVAQATPPGFEYEDDLTPTESWTPSESRPIIRPPVKTPLAMSAQAAAPAAPAWANAYGALDEEELGIGDSEYDKPTFMRRRATQEQSNPHGNPPGRHTGERE